MRAKRPTGKGKGGGVEPKPRRSPRGTLPPAATGDGVSLGQPRMSAVVPGAFGDQADRMCRDWLEDLDGAEMGDRATVTGRLESAVLLVVGREAVLESVCIPDGADRFRFVGALRLLAHRLERGMVGDD